MSLLQESGAFQEGLNNGIEVQFPDDGSGLDQDEEWCEARIGGLWQRVRFHDYRRIYRIPGLYENLFYDRLQCCSPQRVVHLLEDVLDDYPEEPEDLRVLDVGAGNGMVGEQLREIDVDSVVGVDIIDEARQATRRDRPEVYDDYHVADLTDLPEQQEHHLREAELNCLTTVAALGFGDVPARAFTRALDLIETPGWLAFNIKEEFIRDDDDTGFCRLIRRLNQDGIIRTEVYWRYCHRLTITGEPLYYAAMVARKLRDVTDEYLDIEEPSPG